MVFDNLRKAGPGSRSKPGEVNTEEWWRVLSETGEEEAAKPNSIVQQAKDKDIWFCTIPFTQVYSEIDGTYQACCFGGIQRDHTVKNTMLRDWMENSEYMNSIRREMLDPNTDFKAINQHCKRCRDDEERYGRSRRTNCMKIHTNDTEMWDGVQRSADLYRASGVFEFDERIHEIQLKIFGSQCNLDCHMCFHSLSTTRQKSAIEGGVWNDAIWGKLDAAARKRIDFVNEDRSEGMIEQIVELAPYTRHIKIIGGEPLIMKRQYELLDALIECGESHNIKLKYQTNLTKMQAGKHKFVNYIPYFKEVIMVGSVDGIGNVNDYLRRRSSFKELENNVDILQDFDNVLVDFNGLVSFLSVMRFYEVIDYVKGNDKINAINWSMVEIPRHFRVNNLPKPLKEKLIPVYKDWPDIVAALEMEAEPDINIQDTIQYLLKQDEHYKGTRWEGHLFDVFPELEEFYIPSEITSDQEIKFAMWDKQLEQQAGDMI